jgi:hypothetical protein
VANKKTHGFEVLTLVVMKPSSACHLLLAGILLGLFFNTKDGGNMFLQNAG